MSKTEATRPVLTRIPEDPSGVQSMFETLFVSIRRTMADVPTRDYTIERLSDAARGNWCITVAKASRCEWVVAVMHGQPLAMWRLVGAYPHPTETYGPYNRPRVALDLGVPMAVFPIEEIPSLRNGCATGHVLVPDPPSPSFGVEGAGA